MPRPVKARNDYTADRSRLANLEQAIRADLELGPAQKSGALAHLMALAELLLEADRARDGVPQDNNF
jgi:hypothetical protein